MRKQILLLLVLGLALPSAVMAGEYKVIYLDFTPEDVAEGQASPIVLEHGMLLDNPKKGVALSGCQPMKECRGTFEIPALSRVLSAMYVKGWTVIDIQPVTKGELRGGWLAFLRRGVNAGTAIYPPVTPLPTSPRP